MIERLLGGGTIAGCRGDLAASSTAQAVKSGNVKTTEAYETELNSR
jgi:hypothetical protein